MSEESFDILIVGAGVVGSALANRLACESVPWSIGLVEASAGNNNTEEFDPRVVALTNASQSLFDAMGLWQSIADVRACPYYKMHIWDGEGSGVIDFDSIDVRQHTLGHIVENRVILDVLHEAIETQASVKRITGSVCSFSQLQKGLQEVTLESGDRIQAKVVVAADGAHSSLRQLAGIQVRQWSYQQRAIVTTVKTSKSHNFTASQRFMSTGPLAFLPLQKKQEDLSGHYCSIVWSADDDYANALMDKDDAEFCSTLERSFESHLGTIQSVAKRYCIPLVQRHAKTYIAQGLALVGDAAHSIHPLAGQGVNLGLLDVECIAQEFLRAHQRSVPLGHISVLRRYQRNRMGHNLSMMAAMEGFKRLFGSQQLGLLWLRNVALRGVSNIPALKNLLARNAMGIK